MLTCAGQPLPLYRYGAIASTNRTLRTRLDAGEMPPLAAIAREQTAGRGQHGRTWHSAPGGLYLSVALPVQLAAGDRFHLTLVSAAGIAAALRARGVPVAIKWPNDLISRERKLGGILCETRSRGHWIETAIVGVGINWRNPTPATGIALSDISSAIASLDDLCQLACDGILSGWQRYCREGIFPLLERYSALCTTIARQVTVDGEPGRVTAIAPDGSLQIQLRGGRAVSVVPGTMSLGYG